MLIDVKKSWETSDPDFSLCFEKTVLVWTPCLVLWLLSPLELWLIYTSKCRDIPWGLTNILKLLLNLSLITVSIVSMGWSAVRYFQDEQVFLLDLWTPAIQTITFMLAAVLLMLDKVRGLHTSGVLFVFWLLLGIAGAAQFRTEILRDSTTESEEENFKYILYMIYYPIVLLMLVLNLFADPPPRSTDYPKYQKLCPEVQASFISKIIFGWFEPLIYKGFRKPLTVSDLWDLRYKDTSSQIVPRFEKNWKKKLDYSTRTKSKTILGENPPAKESETKPVSVLGPLFKTFWLPIVASGFTKVLSDALVFINPQILNLMISFVAGKDYLWKGFVYAAAMFLAAEMQTILTQNTFMNMYNVGINWRTSLMSSIYKKALRVSSAARKSSTVGEVVNLMAVDAQRCSDFAQFIHFIWTAPIIIVVALYFLWQILGVAVLAGLAVMIVIIPFNGVIANKMKKLQTKQMKYKDERVKLINEILTGIKVLKLYAWEPSFKDYILKIRDKELLQMRTSALYSSSISFLWLSSSFLVSFATFVTFVLIDERNVLTAEIAFVSAALFNVMRFPIALLPLVVTLLLQFLVSVKRISKFMNAEELDFGAVTHDENRKEPLIIENGVFSWNSESAEEAVLRNITLKIEPGKLVAVVGAVGSGKSSLISAFLGEMDKISGNVNTKGKIAYVPQQAWIQNATVKDNILFGVNYNSKEYDRTVENCALKPDFDMLPAGDNTEIGEKGINLSGGQKQRVSLARAVYNDADTYLLDDPLSAVDSHVGRHIFDNVIGPKGQLRKKTRVLVTHGVTFLHQVDVIVVMKAGEISEMGTFKELLAKRGEFSDFLVHHIAETEQGELDPEIKELIDEDKVLRQNIERKLSIISSADSFKSGSSQGRRRDSVKIDTKPIQKKDKLVQVEKTETGKVKYQVYIHYLKSIGLFLGLATIFFQLVSQASNALGSIWLSKWTSDTSAAVDGVQVMDKRNTYIEVYAAFGFGQVVSVVLSSFALAFGSLRASRILHQSMLANILRAPMSFFDTTPTGRLVNRFGKDVDTVDSVLPLTMTQALAGSVTVIATLGVIVWSTPIFASVILPVGLLYYFVQKMYVATSRQLKRIEAVSRSPIYSHFSETISGASSIRAYGVENRFMKTLEEKVDENTACLFPSLVSNRWLGVRLETIGNILILFAALFAVLKRDSLDPGIVGLSISYALQITSMLNAAVRFASEVETNIVSVERIKEYAEVPQEAAWEIQPRPNPEWPNQGVVQFQDYQVRYREGLELVLKGVTFTVSGGEKVGIVGRTGAGKSSLTLGLFRIIEAAGGHIFIDGLDISKIGLKDLRSKLTIIPQDPVLFSGTLRMNLDPFEMHSDSDVWRALELAHLSNFTRGLNLGLLYNITEGGENLSVGQRQLICLARAVLRKTKVLILDEATAAIDLETDDLIQATIRKEFRDCTVLTIAHRLNTIMDSDRVLVLDKGHIKEFDSPQNLLKSPSTIFYGMARDAGLT
ncbi:Canalicular multispecific organic anion transporter 1 [Homalodisca vitripennis]|nr:Canalicular multispecific organic anion transporter 1 [Homalodisca vitripennis]